MKRRILTFCLLLILIVPQAWGAMTKYPDPDRVTTWNNMTDSVHTWGQTPKQANLTKMKLHNQRAKARWNSIKQAKQKALEAANNQ